jgi:signal transduction histidine kinase
LRLAPARPAGLTPARVDTLAALTIALLLEGEILFARSIGARHTAPTAVAGLALAAPVALRRRAPGAALLCSAAVAALQETLGGRLGATGGTGTLLAVALLSYSTGAWLALRPALLALLPAAALFGSFVAQFEADASAAATPALIVLAAPWLVGRVVRERTRRAGAVRALALQTEREQEEQDRAAIAHERLRIGVELQDIVAHGVSAMVIQSAAARRLLRSDPPRAREAMLAVEQTGRQALADLRRLLGMLRREDDPRALAPQPGLAQLAALLAGMQRRGLACELHTEGAAVDLTPGLDLVSYRVIEAALGCAAQSGGTRAEVELGYDRGGVRIAVRSDGLVPDGAEPLRAVDQRVTLYGGRLELRDGGGDLDLRVMLPFAAAPAAA